LAPVSDKVIRQARNRSLIRRDVTAAEIIAVAAERWMRTRQVQPGPRARPRQRRVAHWRSIPSDASTKVCSTVMPWALWAVIA
jgi:hypothetical protein